METRTNALLAQKELMKAGKSLSDAGLRLRGTKYEREYIHLWEALVALNTQLIQDIRRGRS